jgi:hypothetical protein
LSTAQKLLNSCGILDIVFIISQDFSKILVVLGLQNSGGGISDDFKANGKINRVMTNAHPSLIF